MPHGTPASPRPGHPASQSGTRHYCEELLLKQPCLVGEQGDPDHAPLGLPWPEDGPGHAPCWATLAPPPRARRPLGPHGPRPVTAWVPLGFPPLRKCGPQCSQWGFQLRHKTLNLELTADSLPVNSPPEEGTWARGASTALLAAELLPCTHSRGVTRGRGRRGAVLGQRWVCLMGQGTRVGGRYGVAGHGSRGRGGQGGPAGPGGKACACAAAPPITRRVVRTVCREQRFRWLPA